MYVLLTFFQPEGADYAHHITASTPGFENLTTSLDHAQHFFKNEWTLLIHNILNKIKYKLLNGIIPSNHETFRECSCIKVMHDKEILICTNILSQ
jgi:hypothetical protein